jgi:hypothetical protein
MIKVARIEDGVVVEILTAPRGVALSDCFHPSILAYGVPCGDDAQIGWVYADGVLYDPENPPVVPEPVEAAAEEPAVEEPAEVPATPE